MKKRKKRLTDLEMEREWWRTIADDFSYPIQLIHNVVSASFRPGICSALQGLERRHNYSRRAATIASRCSQAIELAFANRPMDGKSHIYLFPQTFEGAKQRVEFCEEQARRCTDQIRKKKAK